MSCSIEHEDFDPVAGTETLRASPKRPWDRAKGPRWWHEGEFGAGSSFPETHMAIGTLQDGAEIAYDPDVAAFGFAVRADAGKRTMDVAMRFRGRVTRGSAHVGMDGHWVGVCPIGTAPAPWCASTATRRRGARS